MRQRYSTSGLTGIAATTTRVILVAAGLSAAGAASAANCSEAPVSGQKYYVVNKDTGLQLDVSQASKADGASVLQWYASGQGNQQWTLSQLSNGAWTMVAAHSNSALDLYGWSGDENAPIKQWSYTGNSNQQWKVTKSGDAFTIASSASNKFLTVADKSAGTLATQHSAGSGSQQWYFNPVDGKCGSGATATTTATGSFGSFMGRTKILIGGKLEDATVKAAPFDVVYSYVHSAPAPYEQCYEQCYDGCDANGWWGCWGATKKWDNSSGIHITSRNKYPVLNSEGRAVMRHWTWYSAEDIGIVAGKLRKQYSGGDDKPDYKGALRHKGLLKGYFDDYRFFLQKIGTNANMIHLEPDFWGFIRETSGDHPNDPHYMPAVVRDANPTDCGSEEDSAAGVASCLIKMTRKYATKSTVGMHITCWDWAEDETATRGLKACTEYFRKLGAGSGDFLATDVTDRDAAWAVRNVANGQSYWWDDAKWAKYVKQIKTLTETFRKPMVLWQVPLGNMNMTNWKNHWQDDKVWYIFNKMMIDLQNAHVIAIEFGGGQSEQTGDLDDGGYFLQQAKKYYSQGGLPMK